MNYDLQDYLFDLQGFCILRNAVDSAHIAALNAELDKVPADMPYLSWRGNVQRLDNNKNAGMELQNIVEGGEPFERLIDHPAWIERVARYCGESNSYVAGLFIDECFASIRRTGGFFPFHSGGYQGALRGKYHYEHGVWRCGQVNILLALTDIGPGDGGTLVIPGSHKGNFVHPSLKATWEDLIQRGSNELEGGIVKEVHLRKGDALLFVDGICHGASPRTNAGERRVVIYRYGVSWGNTRHGYRYSEEFLNRLTPARRKIMEPVPTRNHANPGGQAR